MDKSLVNLTAHEARDMLDRGDVSSLELTEASLERIEEIDDRVKAFFSDQKENVAGDSRIASHILFAPIVGESLLSWWRGGHGVCEALG